MRTELLEYSKYIGEMWEITYPLPQDMLTKLIWPITGRLAACLVYRDNIFVVATSSHPSPTTLLGLHEKNSR